MSRANVDDTETRNELNVRRHEECTSRCLPHDSGLPVSSQMQTRRLVSHVRQPHLRASALRVSGGMRLVISRGESGGRSMPSSSRSSSAVGPGPLLVAM